MAADFQVLTDEVTALEGVVPSVVAIINGIADQIAAAVAEDNIADNTAIGGLADRVRAQAAALADAANTNG